jgi:hypothetical protein
VQQTNSVAFSPQANYTKLATATCWRNLVPIFADRGVSRGQRGGSPTVVNGTWNMVLKYTVTRFVGLCPKYGDILPQQHVAVFRQVASNWANICVHPVAYCSGTLSWLTPIWMRYVTACLLTQETLYLSVLQIRYVLGFLLQVSFACVRYMARSR